MKSIFIICLIIIASLFVGTSLSSDVQADSMTCDMCDFVLQYIEGYVTENKTEDQIITELEKVCAKLPATYAQDCDETINNYGVLIVRFLINKEDPSNICKIIELCPSSSSTKSSSKKNNKIIIDNNNNNEKGSGECMVCQYLAGEIRNFITSNSTETDILSYLDNKCNFLKSSNWVNTCQNLVQQYEPIIFSMISNKEEPCNICVDIKFCPDGSCSSSSSSSSSDSTKNVEIKDSAMDCEICTLIAGYTSELLESNKTMDDIVDFLKKRCTLIPNSEYATDCAAMVASYIPDIITMLENNFTPQQICQKFSLCPPPNTPSPQAINKLSGSTDCQVCTFVTTYIKSILVSNGTLEDIESFVKTECNKLPGSLATDCTTFADAYIPDILTLLQNNFTPAQICQKFGLCPPPNTPSPQAINKLSGSTDCQVCTFVTTYIKSILAANSTLEDIEAFVKTECNKLPGSLGSDCTTFADAYIPDILTLLQNNFTPAQICQKFGLCPPPNTPSPQAINNLNGAVDCQICTFVTTYVKSILVSNSTLEDIEAFVKTECNKLPGSLGSDCTTFADAYIPDILTLLQNNFTPEQICQKFGLCPPPNTPSPQAINKLSGAVDCQICTYVTTYIKSILAANSTLEDIESFVNTECNKLPGSLGSACTSFADTYIPDIITLLQNDFTAEQICQKFGLCPPPNTPSPQATEIDTCEICTMLATYVEKYIASGVDSNDVQEFIQDECNKLPSSLSSACNSLVTEYFNYLVDMVENKFSPSQICQFVRACPAPTPSTPNTNKNNEDPYTDCTVCTLLANYAIRGKENNATEQYIEDQFKQICQVLSKSWINTCYQIVNQYGEQIIEDVYDGNYDAEQVCVAIHQCQSSSGSSQSSGSFSSGSSGYSGLTFQY